MSGVGSTENLSGDLSRGVLVGTTVVELPSGVAGAMAGMLLSDHGADVIKVELPRRATLSGAASTFPYSSRPVWDRGKRSVVVDPGDAPAMDRLREVAARADILIGGDGGSPYGGVDLADGPSLLRCRITGYGTGSQVATRPAYDALVAARLGMPWDQRGWAGGAPAFIGGVDEPLGADRPLPPGADQMGRQPDSPVYLALPWPSIGAALLAVTGLSAALYEHQRTGRGQLIDMSLLQGGLLCAIPTWQRVGDPVLPGYRLAYFDRRNPKGLFRCGDGLWLHQWAPFEHAFVRAAAAEADFSGSGTSAPPAVLNRPAGGYEAEVEFEVTQFPVTAAAFARMDRDTWVNLFAQARKAAQPVRSPEEALIDPISLSEGCVASVDGEFGPTFQVGEVYRLSDCPTAIGRRAPRPGEHNLEVLGGEGTEPAGDGGARRRGEGLRPGAGRVLPSVSHLAEGLLRGQVPGPLDGITVIDMGVAMAGPYGAQTLGDLGARVIKVHNPSERVAVPTSPVLGCQRGKQSIAIDLKTAEGREVLYDLVRRADVVHHNLRIGVAERLGAGYEELSRINPRLVYCHTRGFEASGPRSLLPGNDQVGQALAGTWYEMGAGHAGGDPIWHPSALGDFGNGVASAIAVIQALYHRERTGRGQAVDTSILNVGLLYNSYTHARPDGSAPERARVRPDLLGVGALCRLYRCREGWLCLVAPEEHHWEGLVAAAADDRLRDPTFSSPAARTHHDEDLGRILAEVFASDDADRWSERLDAHGVPAEVVDREFPRRLFEDPDALGREWVVRRPHPVHGFVEQAGRLVEFSRTPGIIGPAAPLVGEHTRAILRELGRSDEGIDRLLERGVVAETIHAAGPPVPAGTELPSQT